MNNVEIELPDSLKECLPCQKKVIASHLIALCKISKELSADIDCMGLAESLYNGEIKTEDVIQTIADHAQGKSVEEAVDKIVHILDKK